MRFHAFSRDPGATTGDRLGPASADGPVVAAEAEAFLDGTLATLRAAQKRPLAPWMMINLVAHADPAELRRLVQGEPSPVAMSGVRRRYNRAWARAQRSLAREVLRSGHEAGQIWRVQHDVLVPLELRLISRSTTELFTLGRVLADAIEALDQHRLGH